MHCVMVYSVILVERGWEIPEIGRDIFLILGIANITTKLKIVEEATTQRSRVEPDQASPCVDIRSMY